MLGGYRNTMTMVITGLDVEAKAEHATRLLLDRLGGAGQYQDVDIRLLRFDQPDAPANELATAHLRVTVKDPDERKVCLGLLRRYHRTGPGRLRRIPHHHPARRGPAPTGSTGPP